MEISSNSHVIRKKRKRKSKSNLNTNFSYTKPALFDGMSNWLNLQKDLAKTKVEEKSSINTKSHKKDLEASNQVKPVVRRFEKKAQYKFNFAERMANLPPVESELRDHSPENGDSTRLTKTVAMDCEMVGTGPDGKDSIIARVSIVNAYGDCIYDEFVKPKEKVTDFRTEISGVRPADLKKGKDLLEVQREVLNILDGRRIVGHDLKHDFDVLFISHPKHMIRDTSRYKPFREVSGGRVPSLKKLAHVLLDCNIQGGEHSSVEDAQAAMLLYLRHKREWEKSVKSLRKRRR